MKTNFTDKLLQSVLCLLLCAPVLGQTSTDVSQGEPEAGVQQAEESDTAEEEEISEEERARREARLAELTQQLEVRLRAIEELQSEQGVYHPALIEAYSDLANVHVELENYDQASRYLTDALQIARINTGLFSEQQLPVIDELIKNHMRKQDWGEVDDLIHLDHHIASRVYQLEDQEYLAAADDYGQWKLRVLRENLLQQSGSGLMNTAEDLSEFYERLIASVEFSDEVGSEDLLKLLHGKSQADLSLARAVAQTPYTYFQGTVSRYITRQRCENVRNAAGQLVRQCYSVQVENPRYRQSQIDAKRFAVNRYTREVNEVIERMMLMRDSSDSLNAQERRQLDTQIANLQAEAETIRRLGYRNYRF
ncbi:MAG: tetratricopeptide repeat protein [Gammaproteobacteria bacterium]